MRPFNASASGGAGPESLGEGVRRASFGSRIRGFMPGLMALWTVFAAATAAAAPPAAKDLKAPASTEDRRFWAYPRGVFVGAPDAAAPKAVRTEVAAFARRSAEALTDCAAAVRDGDAAARDKGVKFNFTLGFTVNPDGKVYEAQIRKLAGSADLLPCMLGIAGRAEELVLPPLPPPKGTRKVEGQGARITFAVMILTDDEAKGRGYLFLQAERAWEQALRENRHWFACGVSTDCVLVYEACEVSAVAVKHEVEFSEAARKRVKGTCREPKAAVVLTPVCRAGRCASLHRPASGP